MVVALTLTKEFITQALVAKKTPLYAKEDKYKGVSYDEQIYPQARIQFKEYDKLYPTNEEFTEYFVRDFNRKDARLLQTIRPGATTEQILAWQPGKEVPTEQVPEEAPAGGETPTTMAEGTPTTSGVPFPAGPTFSPSATRPPTVIVRPEKQALETQTTASTAAPPSAISTSTTTAPPTSTVSTTSTTAFQPPKIPSQFVGAGKSLASSTKIGLKRGLAKVGSGFSSMLGGMAGGGGRFLGRAALAGSDVLVGISNQVSRGSLIKGPPKKFVIGGILGFVLLVAGLGFIPPPSSQPSPSAPPQAVYPPYQAGVGSGVISCPLNNAKILAGSRDTGGHCSASYQIDNPCVDPDVTGRATAMDLQSPDRTVYLPNLGGSSVSWLIEQVDTNTDYIDKGVLVNGGFSVIARAEYQGKAYRIRFVHLQSPNLQPGQQASSGTAVGMYRTRENHVHTTIQEDGVFKPTDLYFNLCQ